MIMTGTRSSITFTTVLCIIKIILILGITVVAGYYAKPSNLKPFFKDGFHGVMVASSVVFFSFLGFEGITAIAEESIDPKKDVPRAVIGGIGFCTTIYAVTSFLILSVYPTTGLATETATSAVFNAVGAPTVATFVYIGAFLGILSATYTCFVPQIRIVASMSDDGLLPSGLSKMSTITNVPVMNALV